MRFLVVLSVCCSLASLAFAADPALPEYEIRIKDKALRKFLAHSEELRDRDFLSAEDRLWVKATFVHEGTAYRVKLRLRGDLPAHWRGEKQSYRLKFKDRPFEGQRQFNLIVPWDKHYAVEWLQTRIADDLGLLSFPGRFVNVAINGQDAGLYYQSEHPTAEYLERHGRMPSSIFTFGSNWTYYFGQPHHYIHFELPGSTSRPPIESIAQIKQRQTLDDDDPELARKQLAYLQRFYALLTRGGPSEIAAEVPYYLDLEKFARYVALQDFFGSTHGMALNDNARLYLDPSSGKFEFIPWDTALWSLSERAEERGTNVAGLLTPEDPVFRKLLSSIPGLRARRDEILRDLVAAGEGYRSELRAKHEALLRAYPQEERLQAQTERHDAVLAENLRLLSGALGR